jgi:hypothetical protein
MIAAAGCPSSRRAGRTVTLSAPGVLLADLCCLAVADDDAVTLEHCRYRISETAHGRCTPPLVWGPAGGLRYRSPSKHPAANSAATVALGWAPPRPLARG